MQDAIVKSDMHLTPRQARMIHDQLWDAQRRYHTLTDI